MKNIHQRNEKHQPHDTATNYNVEKVQENQARLSSRLVLRTGLRFDNGGSDKVWKYPHTPHPHVLTPPHSLLNLYYGVVVVRGSLTDETHLEVKNRS